MPGKGYSTIGVKPSVMERLQQITDKNYLGMFLPSTLIIMMNEVKAGRYTIHVHKLRLDLTGRYNTITIRSDIKEWLKSSYEDNKEEYLELYNVKCFTRFVSYFIVNMIESKNDLEKALEWCTDNKYLSLSIFGVSGKSEDHFLGNFFDACFVFC